MLGLDETIVNNKINTGLDEYIIHIDHAVITNTLSNTSFKKVPINPTGAYSLDVSKFYNELPINLRYEILRTDSDLSVFANCLLYTSDAADE